MRTVFISPCFNASPNLKHLIKSVQEQKNKNWIHVIIDDLSEDDTFSQAQQLTENDERFTVVKNDEKKFALRNIIEEARKYQNNVDDIIAVIDGDDQLCNENSVDLLLNSYEKGSDITWTAHRWDINGMNISKSMPDNVNPYQWLWSTSHLRTFRSSLLLEIDDKNFQDISGNWFERGYDQALMLPLLYKTHNREYIDEVCYLYNINSVSVNDRDWAEMKQISTINFVRARGFVE